MIIALIEHDRGRLNESSFEALTAARRLAAQSGVPLSAILIGADAGPHLERVAVYGVSTLYQVEHDRLVDYAPAAWARGIAEVITLAQPQVVMAAGSERGNEVMAHLAARLGLPMAANCTEIRSGDAFEVTRLRWGGSLLEDARLQGTVKLLTLAVHAVAAEESPAPRQSPYVLCGAASPRPASNIAGTGCGSGDSPASPEGPKVTVVQVLRPNLSDKDFRARVIGRIEAGAGKISLADARVVVGGGRGVGSAEGFKDLEELAGLLNGTVGVSRVVTSLGWRPHSDQVGQTGTRIAPDLYIACGISGAIQHMVGCKNAKHILAINTDPDATMVSKADYAVIGDLHVVVPAISAALRKAKTSNDG
jgi:electron transfer flavoprotein alpha subunit